MRKKFKVPWRPQWEVSKKKLRNLQEKEIIKLTLKDPDKTNDDIGKHVGLTKRTVGEIQHRLANTCHCRHSLDEHAITDKRSCRHCECPQFVGILPTSDKGRILKPKPTYDEILEQQIAGASFVRQKEIQRMIEYLKAKKKSWATQVSRCLVVCKTINNLPRQIMDYEQDGEKKPFEGLTKAMQMFREHMDNDTVQYINPKVAQLWGRGKDRDIDDYVRAMRTLYRANNLPVPEKYGGQDHVLSVSTKHRGAYNDVQLTDKQYYTLIDYFKEKYGLHHACMFGLLTECVARTDEGFEWMNNLQIRKKVFEDGKEYEYGFIKDFYSSKTNDHWSKMIIEPKVLELLKQLPMGQKIFPEQTWKYKKEFTQIMREALNHIGLLPPEVLLPRKDPKHMQFIINIKKGTETWKMYKDPGNICRHDGTHRGLRRNNYDPRKLIARGWRSGDTVNKFYGKPRVDDMDDDVCLYCKPPLGFDKNNLPENFNFCKEQHAIIFLNNGRNTKTVDPSSIEKLIDELGKSQRHVRELENKINELLLQREVPRQNIPETPTQVPQVPEIIPQVQVETLKVTVAPQTENQKRPEIESPVEPMTPPTIALPAPIETENELAKYDKMSYEELYDELKKIPNPTTEKEIEHYKYIHAKLCAMIEKSKQEQVPVAQ